MAMKVFVDNTTLPASDINEYLVNTKYVTKPSNTTRTGTSPSADPDLQLPYDANKTYLLDMIVIWQGAGGGLKFNFSSGGGNSLYGMWQLQYELTSQGATNGGSYDGGINNNLGATQSVTALTGLTVVDVLSIRGFLATSGTAGTLAFQWSQNSGVGNLTALTGSTMLLRRVS